MARQAALRIASDDPSEKPINRFAFSAAACKTKVCPPGLDRAWWYDTQQPGLAMQVMPSGAKSYYLYCKRRGCKDGVWKSRKYKEWLGPIDELKLPSAREQCSEMLDRIRRGMLPRDEPAPGTITYLGDLWAAYDKLVLPTLSAGGARGLRSKWTTHLQQHARRPLADFTTAVVQALHNAVSIPREAATVGTKSKRTEGGATAARKTVELLSRMFKAADAPCPFQLAAIRRAKPESRDRFLSKAELTKLWDAALASGENIRDFVLMAILTAQRVGNVTSMRFDEIDLDARLWTIPKAKAKARKEIRVHLHPELLAVISRRSLMGSEWVFPGSAKAGHMVRPQTAFNTVCRRAGLKNVCIHDLRRTPASHAASGGMSSMLIGKMLGHSSASATMVYARLDDEPVRDATVATGDTILAAMGRPRTLAEPTAGKVGS